MFPSKVISASVVGLEAKLIEVEVYVDRAPTNFFIVGLADTAIKEAKDRVRAAVKTSGFDYPLTRITASLAPADLRKEGTAFDLPLAIGILSAESEVPLNLANKLFVGELSLEGNLRRVNGVLPITIAAKEAGIEEIFVPYENLNEAMIVKGLNIYGAKSLKEIVMHLNKKIEITNKPISTVTKNRCNYESSLDLKFVKGQEQAKRALEIAAAGSHNVIFSGPPGSGKTMLARSFVTILPEMHISEALEVTKIHSIAGTLSDHAALIDERPFRSPHHTASGAALVGGGTWPRPGEISLAHRGVLFLDEFPEFSRAVLENLRQPLEDGVITIARAQGTLTFPAKFILIASMNPCPCGFFGDSTHQCTCTPFQINNYSKKLSGPLLDRIDMHINVKKVNLEELQSKKYAETESECSRNVFLRVEKARNIQLKRFENTKIITNSEMKSSEILKYCELGDELGKKMVNAADKLGLSARAYFRIIKLARTIADLEAVENIKEEHIMEALQYRPVSIKE